MAVEEVESRRRLTKERVLRAAVEVADRDGIDALTMRRLGAELGVEAMSLYKHVANKDEILDGIIELVIDEIELPSAGDDWQEAMRRRAISARQVLRRHSWAIGLFETRSVMKPPVMKYLDTILGSLRSADFSIGTAAHAFWLLDSYVYGHVIQEASLSSTSAETTASQLGETAIDDYPNLVEVAQEAMKSGYTIDSEFEFGLELILEGLAEHRRRP